MLYKFSHPLSVELLSKPSPWETGRGCILLNSRPQRRLQGGDWESLCSDHYNWGHGGLVSDSHLGNLNVRSSVLPSLKSREEVRCPGSGLSYSLRRKHVVPEAWLRTTRESLVPSEIGVFSRQPWVMYGQWSQQKPRGEHTGAEWWSSESKCHRISLHQGSCIYFIYLFLKIYKSSPGDKKPDLNICLAWYTIVSSYKILSSKSLSLPG